MTDDESERSPDPERSRDSGADDHDPRPETDEPVPDPGADDAAGDHRFSTGQGFSEPEGFDLDPPELSVDPDEVDPVDSRAVAARFADEESIEQEAWVNKGAAHAELEEYDEAIGAYREALRLDDRSEHAASAETNLASALWEAGRTEQALEHAERAVEIDARFPQAWFNRGFFLLERGLASEALDAFDNAIRLGFRNAEVIEEKARALEEVGEDERAEELAAEARELREEAEEELVRDRQRA
ncbi:hypothetical protein BRC98_06485 [Halobacteriales archaeon QS_7_68_65]|nr:MAG: hypothetical protein BRC98_06485 [Halobacteriales archaeon QS_7_68_65]